MKFALRMGWLALMACLFPLMAREFHGTLQKPDIASADFRKYAPDRRVDVTHLALNVTPDFKTQTVRGTMTLSFRPIIKPLKELRLDAINLKVEKVEGSGEISSHENTDKELIIHFGREIPLGHDSQISITYSAEPKKGLYFRTADMGYQPEDEHLFTQGEDIEARHWYPCYDAPNEKFTSEVTCHVPMDMTVLSNGRKIKEEMDEKVGVKTVQWLQDKPHVNYLISLVAGKLRKIEDRYKDIPLAFYTPTSQIDDAARSFEGTKEMMAFFEKEIGVPYPWDKYYQVCVQDFMWGGMENTSISTLTDGTLFPAETENIRSSQGLVAHELAHQWFGDYLTTRDWSHIWLNEGFASYYEKLFTLHKDGRDEFLHDMYKSALPWLNLPSDRDSMPTVYREYNQTLDLFGYTIYNKGAWILHMLRSEVGEEAYRQTIKTYTSRHAFGSVTTPMLIQAFEEVTGRNFDQFFDQWVYHPHHPELQVTYRWDESAKKAMVQVKQVQLLTNGVALFRFPLAIRLKGDFETMDQIVEIRNKEEEFAFSAPKAPTLVRIDPELNLLARIDFPISRTMLLEQAKDHSDLVGRLKAVEALQKIGDQEAVAALADRMNNDPFYGVRVDAVRALRAIHSPEVFEKLLTASEQTDARVRQGITTAITSYYDERARDYVYSRLKEEKNPEIREHLIAALGSYPDSKSFQVLVTELKTHSFQNKNADAAIGAMRAQNNSGFVPVLLAQLQESSATYPTRSLSRGLEALGYLARDDEKKDAVREFLLGYTTSKRRQVRIGAINALGTLGDPQAIAPLEKLALGVTKDATETGPADRAVSNLRAARRTPDEVGSLRGEILDLKRQNQELKKELEAINKKIDSLKPAPAIDATKEAKEKLQKLEKRTRK